MGDHDSYIGCANVALFVRARVQQWLVFREGPHTYTVRLGQGSLYITFTSLRDFIALCESHPLLVI